MIRMLFLPLFTEDISLMKHDYRNMRMEGLFFGRVTVALEGFQPAAFILPPSLLFLRPVSS